MCTDRHLSGSLKNSANPPIIIAVKSSFSVDVDLIPTYLKVFEKLSKSSLSETRKLPIVCCSKLVTKNEEKIDWKIES